MYIEWPGHVYMHMYIHIYNVYSFTQVCTYMNIYAYTHICIST